MKYTYCFSFIYLFIYFLIYYSWSLFHNHLSDAFTNLNYLFVPSTHKVQVS